MSNSRDCSLVITAHRAGPMLGRRSIGDIHRSCRLKHPNIFAAHR